MRSETTTHAVKKTILFILPILLITLLTACTTTTENISRESVNETIDKTVDETANMLQVDDEGNTKFDAGILNKFLNQAAAAELSTEEIAGIKFMLEEEKLARDVYLKLYEKWNQQSFSNISQSEKTHIGAIRSLAEKYGIDISFYNDEVGEFTDEKLLGLYNDLVTQGEGSLVEALKVGALIEEIDILDLEEYLSQTDKDDIALVYENLIRGSRNHLRSFVRTMTRQGQDYEPQRLGKTNYEEIINSENERGGSGQGSGMNSKGQGRNRN